MSQRFRTTAQDLASAARTGVLETPHGEVETPAFMPVASQGTVKALTHGLVESLGAQIILLNSYHLSLRPGVETIEAMGGLHSFIGWPKPILTDSGGFQIYSLSPLVRISDEGVRFASHLDGTKIFLTPEDVVDLQVRMGTDILMCLDHFPSYPYSEEKMAEAVRLTTAWARRSRSRFARYDGRQHLWGISQGGIHWDLRRRSIESLVEMDFSGYAYGGLGIGEPKTELFEVLEKGHALLPADRPATSWAWDTSRTSSRPWRGASISSTASCRPGTPATGHCSRAGAGSPSRTPSTPATPGRSTRPAAAPRAGIFPGPTCTTFSSARR
jgi:queuine tRNA-ribosyltransferase